MEMKGDYPALTTAGLSGDHRVVAKQQFLMPFASNHSQSNFYHGNIESMSYQWQQTGGDMSTFPEAVAAMYERLFGSYFEVATATVERIVDSPNAFILGIVYGDGTSSDTLSDTIFTDGNVVVLSNYGIEANL